jgi:LacI family transcriptional regulator
MTRRKEVTITDVAREAQVSAGTVSRVLNERPGSISISDETKEKVWAAVQKLGYKANPFAAALRTKRTGIIGTVVRDIRDPFLNRLVRELQIVASQKDIELVLSHANYDIATAGRQINRMISHYFDGLIILGDITGDQALITQLRQFATPFVAVARGFQDLTTAINVDEENGTVLALDYLTELGHRKIAFLGGTENIGMEARLKIFETYAAEKNLTWEPYLRLCPNHYKEAGQAAQTIFDLDDPPSAIFCATDVIALGTINSALYAGLRIPEQISIIGFDNIDDAAEVEPGLTTIDQPAGFMASKAIEILMEMINDASLEPTTKKISAQPTLIVRQSCGPLSVLKG